MGFRNGAFASVFSVREGRGNYYDVRIATSRKDPKTDNYVTDFSGFVRFAGSAANVIKKYLGMDSKANGNRPITRIKLGDVDTTNNFDAQKKITYTNHVVFSCEEVDNNGGVTHTANTATPAHTAAPMPSLEDYVNTTLPTDEDALFT